MVRSWRILGLLLVACGLVLSACGGKSETDKKNDYKKDAKAIVQQAKGSLESLQSRVQGKSGDAALAELGKTRQEVVDAADRLDKLTPPDDVKTEHDKFVAALRKFGDDFKKVEDAGKAKDQAAAKEALSTLQADATELKASGDALDTKLK
jgi:cytochrome c556